MSQYTDEFLHGLTEGQIAILNNVPLPEQLFAIVSWGCAATKWLAKALNSHPDIFCLHAMNSNWVMTNDAKISSPIDGLDYMRFIAKSAYGYKAAGDIHGVSRPHIPELRRILGDKFNAVVVVREPLPRLKSQVGLFHMFQQHKLWNVDYIDDVIKNKHLSLPIYDYEHKLFVHGVNMLNAITEEVDVGKIFRSEDLTTNADMLGKFIEEISCNKVETNDQLLHDMIRIDKVNRHKENEIEFEDWQIEVIKKTVDEKAWKLYSKLDYETQLSPLPRQEKTVVELSVSV